MTANDRVGQRAVGAIDEENTSWELLSMIEAYQSGHSNELSDVGAQLFARYFVQWKGLMQRLLGRVMND